MGKKSMGAPTGGAREPAQKRRPPKRARRAGGRSPAPNAQSPVVSRAGAPKTAKPRTKPIPAETAASPTPQASGDRYPTLARMATLSERAGSSASSASSPSPVIPSLSTARSVRPVGPQDSEERPTHRRTRATTHRLDGEPVAMTEAHQPAPEVAEVADTPPNLPESETGEARQKIKLTPRQPRRTVRLPSADAVDGSTAATPVPPRLPFTETDPLLRQLPLTRPQPLPPPDLIVPVAVAEAGIAAVAALAAAVLLLLGSGGAFWALALTLVAGFGSWLAYGLSRGTERGRKVAGSVLVVSQVGILTWGMVLVGPRVSLLMLAPALLLLSLRMAGRIVSVAGVVGAVGVYGLLEVLQLRQIVLPVLHLDSLWLAFLDGILVIVGLVLLTATALDLHASRSRADLVARSRLQELRQVRTHATQYRLRREDETTHLQEALMAVLYKRGDWPSLLERASSPLQPTVELLAERMAILQRDREERMRLEAALLGLTREVERAWLGLPWSWPTPSDTPLDELVALLRTPTPRDEGQEITQENLPLVPIPSLEPAPVSRPWEVPTQHPRVREHLSDPAWSFAQPDSGYQQYGLDQDRPGTGGTSPFTGSHASPLPWLEWDEWRSWDDRFSS